MKKAFRLQGLDCANCAAKIEKAVQGIDGVSAASVNFMTEKMVIEGEDSRFDEIVTRATEIVHKHEPDIVVKRA